MRSEALFKQHFNKFLRMIACQQAGDTLGSERQIGRALETSRTTVRKCLAHAQAIGLISSDGDVTRAPKTHEFFPEEETTAATAVVEREFLRWVLHSDSGPGQAVNASQLARQFGVSTTTIREFLQSFRHFGLLERRPGGSWVFRGMTLEFANELSDIREIFELRSVLKFAVLPRDDQKWQELIALRRAHEQLLTTIEVEYQKFSFLDEQLHRLINSASSNRFVTEFFQVISLIFFYHYQRNKEHEQSRNKAAVYQHLAYIDAVLSGDNGRITEACRTHLAEARRDLVAAMMHEP